MRLRTVAHKLKSFLKAKRDKWLKSNALILRETVTYQTHGKQWLFTFFMAYKNVYFKYLLWLKQYRLLYVYQSKVTISKFKLQSLACVIISMNSYHFRIYAHNQSFRSSQFVWVEFALKSGLFAHTIFSSNEFFMHYSRGITTKAIKNGSSGFTVTWSVHRALNTQWTIWNENASVNRDSSVYKCWWIMMNDAWNKTSQLVQNKVLMGNILKLWVSNF